MWRNRRAAAWLIAALILMWQPPSGGRSLAWAARQVGPSTPPLPAQAASAEAFAPAGWAIEQRHAADFNGDGRSDLLLLLRDRAGTGVTPRRILLVALAAASGQGYARLVSNDQLIPRDTSGKIEDPMADGEIAVRPRGFDLKIGYLSGAGSYEAATMRFRFRFEPSCFRLIGYDRNETHRGTLETNDLSVNFLTGAVIRSTGNAQTGASRSRRSRLTTNPRRCFQDLPSGWTFDPVTAPRSAARRR
jgi:hypothetical protein